MKDIDIANLIHLIPPIKISVNDTSLYEYDKIQKQWIHKYIPSIRKDFLEDRPYYLDAFYMLDQYGYVWDWARLWGCKIFVNEYLINKYLYRIYIKDEHIIPSIVIPVRKIREEDEHVNKCNFVILDTDKLKLLGEYYDIMIICDTNNQAEPLKIYK